MSVPWRCDDGNFNALLEVGSEFRFPFSDKGDIATFEAVITYRQNKSAYSRLALMSAVVVPQLIAYPNFGVAYLVEQGDTKDLGNGEFEFDRTFASLPITRAEGASISFTQQWWRGAATQPLPGKVFYQVDYDIVEQAFTVGGEYIYEYFLTKPNPLLKTRVYLLFENLQFVAGAGASPSPGGTRLISDDSEVGIYKAGIFYRKTPYVILK